MQAADGQTRFHDALEQFLLPSNVTWASADATADVVNVDSIRSCWIVSDSVEPPVNDLNNCFKPQFRWEESQLEVVCFSGKPQMEFVQINPHTPLTVVNHLLAEETISTQ